MGLRDGLEASLGQAQNALMLNRRYRKALLTRGYKSDEQALVDAGMSRRGAEALTSGPVPIFELLTRNIERLRRQNAELQRQLRGLERQERDAS